MHAINGDWSDAWSAVGETLKKVLGGLVTAVGGAIAAIQNIFLMWFDVMKGNLAKLYAASQQMGVAIVEGIENGLKSAWNGLKSAWNGMVAQLPEAVRNVLMIRSPSRVMFDLGQYVVEGLVQGVESMISRAAKAGEAMALALRAGWDAVPATNNLNEWVAEMSDALDRAEDRLRAFKTRIAESLDPVRNSMAKFAELDLSTWKKLGPAMQTKLLNTRMEQWIKSGGFGAVLGDITRLTQGAGMGGDLVGMGVDHSLDGIAKPMLMALDKVDERVVRMREDLFNMFDGLFSDLLSGSVTDFFGTITRTLSNFVLQQAHAGLAERFQGFLGRSLKIPGFGGGMMSIPSMGPLGGLMNLGSILPGLLKREVGGPVGRGDVALVGEGGPELVQFGRSAHVAPARQTAAMMGGGPIHVTININATDAGSVMRSASQVAQRMGAAIDEARRKHG